MNFEEKIEQMSHIQVIQMMQIKIGNQSVSFKKLEKLSNAELIEWRDDLVVEYNDFIKDQKDQK